MGPECVATDDGAQLSTVTSGKPNGRPILLCHGGPGLWDYLEPISQLLTGHLVHRFDQRGCGYSTGPAEYSMARAVADIAALRCHWGHSDWQILGHSWGAVLALAYAWTYPEHVAGLVLCNPMAPGSGWKAEHRAGMRGRLSDRQLSRHQELQATMRNWHEEIEFNTLNWMPDFADPTSRLQLAHHMAANAPCRVNYAANRDLSQEVGDWSFEEFRKRCGDIAVKTLVLHGASDPRPLWSAKQIVDAVPHAELAVLPEVGHFPWQEDSGSFKSIVENFVKCPDSGVVG